MEQTVPKAIIEKLQKLLRFKADAEKRDSQHELENVMDKIQRLLIEYEIELDKIDTSEQTHKVMSEDTGEIELTPKNEGQWIIHLYNMLCKHNYCRGWISKGLKDRWVIVGERHNIEIIRYLADMLVPRIRGLAKDAYSDYEGHEKRNAFLRGFYAGCVVGIDRKLAKEKEAIKMGNPNITALIIKKDAAVTLWMDQNAPKLRDSAARKLSAKSGMQMGIETGERMNINKGLKSNSLNQNLLG